MSYRVSGGTKASGAIRPWDVPQPGAAKKYIPQKETEEQARERKICLSCSLPDCNPNLEGCALLEPRTVTNRKRPVHYKEIPAEFLKFGLGPKTNREWAEEFNVEVSTISRWRKKCGMTRDIRRPHKN